MSLSVCFIALSEDRRRRLKREEEERLRMLREQQWLEAEERRRAEAAKMQKLKDDAAAWTLACGIREYIAAKVETERNHDSLLQELEEWAMWARAAADSLDPLCRRAKADARIN